ncbi:acid sphingomyelinase-like phosphodiesterase 3b [Grus japonensis]|uniref:Acid sphingomyelinase-like phosphodiesterase 3b n=1 Tax=Grus japonensis TaxID=30415 RepID=A0ABC9W4I5_GRUJA
MSFLTDPSSKMDPPLTKAKPISDGGSTSGITELRSRGEPVQHQEQLQPERRVRICERNTSADTKVSEEGSRPDSQAPEQIPLQPMEKTTVRQAVPLQPMEVNGGADIHL